MENPTARGRPARRPEPAAHRPTADDCAPRRHLVVHHDATSLLAIKRALEEAGAQAIGARSLEQARQRLTGDDPYDAILLAWHLPDHAAPKLVWTLGELRIRPRPYLLAFATTWPQDDLSRAIQLGVDAFVATPVDPRAVRHELNGIERNGISPSRARLLDNMGPRLLRHDESLWEVGDDPDWRARMKHLADGVTGRRGGRGLDRAGHVLRALDECSGRPIGLSTAEALANVADDGPAAIPAIAQRTGLGPSRLRRLHRALMTALASYPARSSGERTQTILRQVVRRVRERGERIVYSAAYRRLRQAAAALLVQLRTDAATTTGFLAEVAAHFTVEATHLALLDQAQVRYVAALIVNEPLEQQAMDFVRLVLLGHVLRGLPEEVDAERLRALASLLGCGPRDDEDQPARLVIAASEINEQLDVAGLGQAVLQQRLMALEDHVGAGIDTDDLQRRLGRIIDASAPNGEVSQRRFGSIIDILERGEDAPMPLATRHALLGHLDLPPNQRRGEVSRLWTLLGLETPEQERRVHEALIELSPHEGFTALDLTRLAAAARTDDGLEQWRDAGPTGDPAPSTLARAAGRAHVVNLVESLDLDPRVIERVDLVALAEALEGPPLDSRLSPEHVMRLRTLSAVLRGAPDGERQQLLQKFVAAHQDDGATLEALLALLNTGDTGLHLDLRRHLGLQETPACADDIARLVGAGELTNARIAANELSADDPRTVPALSQLAAALQEAGRPQEALPLLERALELQPKRLHVALNLARAKVQLQRYDEARPLLERIAAAAPGFGDSDTLIQKVAAHA